MLTLAGNGRLTRKPELRATSSGATVTTVAIASSRRGSDDDPIYVDLVLWEAQAAFAAEHLVKGQAVTFAGDGAGLAAASPVGTGSGGGSASGTRAASIFTRRAGPLQPSSPRMSCAVRLPENRSPSSMTPRNSSALRRARATTFSSIVSRAIIL